MRRLLTLLLLIPLLSCGNIFSHPRSLVDRIKPSLVATAYAQSPTESFICSGFVVDATKGLALTAQHCLPPDGRPFFVDGIPSLVIKVSDSLALITVPKMTKPPLTIASSNPAEGEEVVSFGQTEPKYVLTWRVVAVSGDGMDIALDGPLMHGMSGGPVVNREGKVVGMNQAIWHDIIGILCGADEIRAFLK